MCVKFSCLWLLGGCEGQGRATFAEGRRPGHCREGAAVTPGNKAELK